MSETNHVESMPDDEPPAPRAADPEQPTLGADFIDEPYAPTKGGKKYIWLSALVVVLGIVIIVIMLTVVKDDDENTPSAPAPTAAPTFPPPNMVSVPDDRLSFLLEALRDDNVTSGYVGTSIPTSAEELIGKTTTSDDPVTRAASWVVRTDSYFAQEEIVSRFVLAVLWYNNGGENWAIKDGWMQPVSVCDWEGVTCCKNFHPELHPIQCAGKHHLDVVELDLHANELTGPIPGSLSLLDTCHALWLSDNFLDGELDPFLFKNMKSLDALYVQNNQLSGQIDGSIRDNGRLDSLYTHGNRFTGDWPLEMCPQCIGYGLCETEPVSYTLDCGEMNCPNVLCCDNNNGIRGHCIRDAEP